MCRYREPYVVCVAGTAKQPVFMTQPFPLKSHQCGDFQFYLQNTEDDGGGEVGGKGNEEES